MNDDVLAIEFKGRHDHISARMQQHAIKKLEKLQRYNDRVDRIEVVADHAHEDPEVELIVHMRRGKPLVAKERSDTFSTAIDVLVRIGDATSDQWADTFATNVFGAAHVTAAALAPLRESRGRAVYISASSVDRPLPGMGVYAASKAALETMARAWQAEHPDVAFSVVRVGSALGTGVTDSWDRELLIELGEVSGDSIRATRIEADTTTCSPWAY